MSSPLNIWDGKEQKYVPLPCLKGEDGKDGIDGYTPQKGVDYFTPEDIEGLNIPSVDQTYTPDSENAQSGKAVAEAVAQSGGGAVDYELIFETILDEPVRNVSVSNLNLKSILILMEITGTIGKGYVYTYVESEKGNILYFPNSDIPKTSKRYVANELRDIGPMYLGLQNAGQWSFEDTNVYMKGQYVPKNGEKITKISINCTNEDETFTAGSKFMIYGVRV